MRSLVGFLIALPLVAAGGAVAAEPSAVGICSPQPSSARVTLAAGPEHSVDQLAAWLAGLTCEPVIIGPDVARHATRLQVVVPGPITVLDARRLFVQTMEAAGLKVTYRRRTYTVSLGPGAPRACPEVAAGEAAGRTRPIDGRALEARLAATITRVDATHVTMPRATVAQLLADPAPFAQGARLLPIARDGQITGFKLYAVRAGGVPARLGLANGDTVTAINGQPLTTLDQALAAFAALREASVGELAVIRRGKPLTLTVTIVP